MNLLNQARTCEEVGRRLELLNIHGGDDKADRYIMLKRDLGEHRADGGDEDGRGTTLEGKTRRMHKDAGRTFYDDTVDGKG